MTEKQEKKTRQISKVGSSVRVRLVKMGRGFKGVLSELFSANQGTESGADVIQPPYDPLNMYTVYENSDLLLPNIEAYSANVDGFGFRLVSRVGLQSEDASDRIREAMFEAEVLSGSSDSLRWSTPEEITEEEVAAELKKRKTQDTIERIRASNFFENIVRRGGFEGLRSDSRVDVEVTGNGYWEMLRNESGKLVDLGYLPSARMALRKLSKKEYPITVYTRRGAFEVVKTTTKRRVRSYVLDPGNDQAKTYYKEVGCAALLGKTTGIWWATEADYEEWKKKNGKNGEEETLANEVIHFRTRGNSQVAYGIPRWVGTTPDVMGNRSASEYNNSKFTNGMMSPKAVLVNGGMLGDETVAALEDIFDEGKGLEGAHNFLIIEASKSGDGDVNPKIEIQDLVKEDTDGSYKEYMKLNEEKVGSQFRIPKIVRGVTEGTYNRATAEAALEQADAQVFTPLRNAFDRDIDTLILPELGVSLLSFQSNGYSTSDSKTRGELVTEMVKEGILVPAEAREVAEDIFDREFPNIDAMWATTPTTMYQYLALNGDFSGVGVGGGEDDGTKQVSSALREEVQGILNAARSQVVTAIGEEALELSGETDDKTDED